MKTPRVVTSVHAALLQEESLGRIGLGAISNLLILNGNRFEDAGCLWDMPRQRTVVRSSEPTEPDFD